jgi:O-antigen/teichoic acid export membrane protein
MRYLSLRTLAGSRNLPWRLWLAGSQVRNILILLAGNALKIGLGLATSALVFRSLGPGNVGRLTLALSIVGLFAILGEFGLRDAAVNYISRFLVTAPGRAYAIGQTFMLCKVSLATLAAGAAFTLATLVTAHFYPQTRIDDLVRWGAFSLLANGLLGYSLVILEARQHFRALAALSMAQGLLRTALIISLFLTNHLTLPLMLVLESVVPILAFGYSLRLVGRPFLRLHRPLMQDWRMLFHFTKWIAVAALASTIFLKLDVLTLSYYRSSAEVGAYAAALALVGRLDVLKSAVLTTAFPDACGRRGPELRAFVGGSLRLTGIATLALLPLFAVGGWLIGLLYGPAYAGAAPAFMLLLAAYLIGLNAEPAAYVLWPLDRPRWIAASDLLQLAVSAVASLALVPVYGIAGAAWAVLLTRCVGALITATLVRRFLWPAGAA